MEIDQKRNLQSRYVADTILYIIYYNVDISLTFSGTKVRFIDVLEKWNNFSDIPYTFMCVL